MEYPIPFLTIGDRETGEMVLRLITLIDLAEDTGLFPRAYLEANNYL